MSVLYDVVSSDHRPLRFCLAIDAISSHITGSSSSTTNSDETLHASSDWAKCLQSDVNNYSAYLNHLLNSVQLPSLCCNNNCSIAEHKTDIDTYFQVINSCIKQAMHTFIPQRAAKVY